MLGIFKYMIGIFKYMIGIFKYMIGTNMIDHGLLFRFKALNYQRQTHRCMLCWNESPFVFHQTLNFPKVPKFWEGSCTKLPACGKMSRQRHERRFQKQFVELLRMMGEMYGTVQSMTGFPQHL